VEPTLSEVLREFLTDFLEGFNRKVQADSASFGLKVMEVTPYIVLDYVSQSRKAEEKQSQTEHKHNR